MIYESLDRSLNDLSTRWSDLNDSVDTLRRLLASSDPSYAVLSSWMLWISGTPPQLASTTITLPPSPVALPTGFPSGWIYPLQNIPNARALLAGFTSPAVLMSTNVPTSPPSAFIASHLLYSPLSNAWSSTVFPTLPGGNDVSAASSLVRERLTELGTAIGRGLQEVVEISTDEGARANLGGIRSSVDDISTYPVLTQDFSYMTPGSSGAAATSTTTAPLGQLVQKALSEVLGRRPRQVDPKSFVAALNQSFTCTDVEGHTVCTWTQRNPSGMTDVGGTITGAQASIWQRAKTAQDAAMPLLEILTPLRVDVDPAEVDAVRAIVRTEIPELITEFGLEGGPRPQRVDELFELLIGQQYNAAQNQFVPVTPGFALLPPRSGFITDSTNRVLFEAFGGGEVGRLGDVFGFTRDMVETVEEEQNLTNYLVIRDYINSLLSSWQTFRPSFLGGVDNYLGTQLILLQRTLSVIAESVGDVTYAMDSVFLGPAERQTVRIEFPSKVGPPMYVDQLLSWVESFASSEGTAIVEEGGKSGLRTIVPTLKRLHSLIEATDGRIRHSGANHPRVRRTLAELASQLREAARLAGTVQ